MQKRSFYIHNGRGGREREVSFFQKPSQARGSHGNIVYWWTVQYEMRRKTDKIIVTALNPQNIVPKEDFHLRTSRYGV